MSTTGSQFVVVGLRIRVLCWRTQNEAGAGGVYEPAGEVKQQLRVLEELDRAEQRTREESERTAILRAAKVPSAHPRSPFAHPVPTCHSLSQGPNYDSSNPIPIRIYNICIVLEFLS